MAIAKLSIDLEARLANLQAGLDKAGLLSERAGARMDAAFGGLRATLVGLGSALSVGALVTFFRATVDGVDKLNDLADATGESIENLSALEDIAARTGTSMDTAGDAVIKLNKALAEARKDRDSPAGQAIKNLGLDIEALMKLSPVERLQAVGKALNAFAGDNKLAYNLTLLGKGMQETAQLMKELGDAGTLVGTMTKEQTEEFERFNKELFALQKTTIDFSRTLVGPVVTALNETIAVFRKGRNEGKLFDAMLAAATPDLRNKFLNGGGATGSWGDEAPKPKLPEIVDAGKVKADAEKVAAAAKRAAELRRQLAEFSARQVVEIEEQAAQDTADAWKSWERQQIDLAKLRADAEKEQWRQVFEFIDRQQDEAIEQGQAILETAKKASGEWSVFVDQSARNIQDAIGNTLEDTLRGNFENIGELWKNLLIRMASEAAAARIGKELFGDFGTSGNIGGSIGDLLKWLPALFAADGAAFGPAGVRAFAAGGILGPGGGLLTRPTIFPMANGGIGLGGEAGIEAVMPLKRGRNGKLGVQMEGGRGGVALTYAPQITIDARTDQAQVAQIVSGAVQEGQRQMLQHLKASGVLQ